MCPLYLYPGLKNNNNEWVYDIYSIYIYINMYIVKHKIVFYMNVYLTQQHPANQITWKQQRTAWQMSSPAIGMVQRERCGTGWTSSVTVEITANTRVTPQRRPVI